MRPPARRVWPRVVGFALLLLWLGWLAWSVTTTGGLAPAVAVVGPILLSLFLVSRKRFQEHPLVHKASSWVNRQAIFYRLIASCPECTRFPDDESRRYAALEFEHRILNKWWYFASLMLVLPTLGLAPLVAGPLSNSIPYVPYAVWVIGFALFDMSAFFLAVWLAVRHRARRHLRKRLVDRAVPICIHCGYDLRGQTVPRCPECGREFDGSSIHPGPARTAEDSASDGGAA